MAKSAADERGLVAESTQPEDPSSAFFSVRSYGPKFQLRQGIQEPRPECRNQGPACLDDIVAGVVAGRLRSLRWAFHSHGMAQRRYIPYPRRPRRGRLWPAAFCAAEYLARQ